MIAYIIAAVVLLLLILVVTTSSSKNPNNPSNPDSPDSPDSPIPPNPNNALCIGNVVDGILTVREQPHGQCGSDMECDQGECAGQPVPRCFDSYGNPTCPTCKNGEYSCTYYAGDQRIYPMQPTGATREGFPSYASEFRECLNRGDACKWGAMNGTGLMTSTGRGDSNPSKITGYRVVGSNGTTFYRDAGFDNSASFTAPDLYTVNNIDDCEDKTVEPYTYENVKYDGGYAYVYDVGGQCSVFKIGPGTGTSGTGKYIKK